MYNYYSKINKINEMSVYSCPVTVIRTVNNIKTSLRIKSEELVLGDIVVVEDNQIQTCDLLLLKGECLVN